MRTGKGKTFRIILKNVRGVGKIKVISFLGGAGQNRAVTPLLYICNTNLKVPVHIIIM
jgi:hypothetical protein